MVKKRVAEVSEKIVVESKSAVKFASKNYWMIATIVLALLLVCVLASSYFHTVSKSTAEKKLLDFASSQGASLTVLNTKDLGTLYEINVSFQGQEGLFYISKDGKYFITSALELKKATATDTQTPTPTDVPKSAKPTADFYVFSYCPYGTQMEKALVPVYNLLKSQADINLVFIGAMHGEYEKVESLRQICIQKNYGKDKLFTYLDKFLVNAAIGNCQGVASCVDPLINTIFSQTGIDKAKINTCIAKDAEALYQADVAKAQSLGIGGSPTVVINGVQSQVGRSPALVQQAICSAFTTAPSACSQTLSSTAASAGFGSTGSSSSAASCG